MSIYAINELLAETNVRSTVGLCVKNFFFYKKDMSTDLLEWLLVGKEVGFGKAYLYISRFTHLMMKVVG